VSDLAALSGPAAWTGAGISVRRARDLVLVELPDRTLVIAADSNAAIGDKPGDALAQDPILTGYSAAKVPLMEVLASGATPFLLIDNLCVELEPTGLQILRGIRSALDDAGLEVMVTGSDESNMPTVQTGLGVTVIGAAAPGELRLGDIRPGDELWVVGRRASGLPGDEYAALEAGVARPRSVVDAVAIPGVHEILPVGSHGIAHECRELAADGGVELAWDPDIAADLERSAGASTCFLVAVEPGAAGLLEGLGLPLERIARAGARAEAEGSA
jgi:hypothetical protein